MNRRPAIALFFAALLLVPATATIADPRARLKRVRAEQLIAAGGTCEEALPLLREAREADSGDVRALELEAKCLLHLGRLDEAGAPLEQALGKSPDDAGLHLMLGIVRYHEEDLAAAGAELERARELGASGADLEFYTALVRMRTGDRAGAATAFESARAADPARVEPLASYFEAMNWAADGDESETRTALLRAVDAGPDDPWSGRAQSALDRLDRAAQSRTKRRWLEATIGAEYDDNVILRGTDVTLPREFSDERDGRLVWGLRGGLELLRSAKWSAGVHAGYAGNAHADLDRFDQHFVTGSGWIDRRIDEQTVARLQYDTGYAWVDSESFLFPQSVTPSLFRSWSNGHQSRLFSRFYWHDYRFRNPRDVTALCFTPGTSVCGPLGINEGHERDRTGHGMTVGLEHAVPIARLSTDVAGGVLFHRYFSRGREYSYRGHELRLRSRSQLPRGFALELGASFTYQPYRHASTFPDPTSVRPNVPYTLTNENRRDQIWRFSASIERALTDSTTAELRFRHVNERSNVDVFDYDRNVIGFYLTTRWN